MPPEIIIGIESFLAGFILALVIVGIAYNNR